MCWTSKNVPIMQYAEKDLTVYKIVESVDLNNCISMIYDFEYEYNQYYAIHNIEVKKI